MFFKNLATLFLITLLFCSQNVSARAKYWIYTVDKTDNLWDLTLKYSHVRYWRKIQKLNNIKQPRQIPPGTKIKIPLKWLNLRNARVKVIEISGEPTVVFKNKLSESVKVGTLLESGSAVITDEEENALLEFEDNSRILIKENSEVIMDYLLAYNNTGIADSRIYIKHGETENFVSPNKSYNGTHYQVTTPSAVMAVRGTEYRVIASEEQKISRSEVLKGEVLAGSSGIVRHIPAKNGTIVKQGLPPSPPIKLLPAPDLSDMHAITQTIPIQLAFKAMEGAKAYRIEMAVNDQFSTLVYEDISIEPIVKIPNLPDADYSIRIRAIDHQDLEGFDAIHEFEINALPLPPSKPMPVDGTTIREKTPSFTWVADTGAVAYHIQLSSTSDFSELVIDHDKISDLQYSPDKLEPGQYYWHIASIDNLNESGSFSKPLSFSLKPSPDAPEIEVSELSDEKLGLKWSKAEPGQKYHLQLAEDENFEDIVEDKQLTDSSIALSNLSTGKIYVRIATIDTDGYHGKFSPILTVEIPYRDHRTFFNL